MGWTWPYCAILVLLTASSQLHAHARNKALVLLQDISSKNRFSSFFSDLESRGIELDIKGHRESSLNLREYDNWLYDHLILFTPKAEGFGGSIEPEGILEFVDAGKNVIMAVSSEVSDTMRMLAAEVGVNLDDKGTQVYDHQSYAILADSQDHSLIVSSEINKLDSVFRNEGAKAPILFRGVAASVPSDSQLATVMLSAPFTAYSHDTRKSMQDPPLAGLGISLVTLVQARNNARVMVSGSIDLFSDTLFNAEVVTAQNAKLGKSGNRAFAQDLALWTFQQHGVRVAENLRHRLRDSPEGAPQPASYRIMDDVEFAVDMFEVEAGQKKPFKADDVQVEFVMLDPHVRLPLAHNGQGTFSLVFKVPDVYGVFKYVVEYRHLGYSYIDLLKQVPVRPFKHNEYERFLVCAYPYYVTAFSSMVAFFVLGFFVLYHK